jgi:SAM-dependent methyltransferase
MKRSTTEFSTDQYASLAPSSIEHFYWHRARNRILTRKLRGRLSEEHAVLDLGCGAGVLVAHLRKAGFDCEGADTGHPTTLVPGAEGHLHLGQDAFALSQTHRERFSALLLMDVIEHLPDPSEFLQRCDERFPNVRWILVTVPARMEIWSNFDEYNGHYRRYTDQSLRALATPRAFTLEETGYFFHALYWAARLQNKLVPKRATRVRPPRAKFLHDVVGRVLDWEERTLPRTSRGSSLYAVYSRRLQGQTS